ncbi:MAG: arsenic efflux protein [Parasporobacterium sp.]|nr:arsenic efflux protein [Parasporobacterium sp.]
MEQFSLIGIIADTLIDGIKLIPFLYVTYLIMEYLEHKATAKTNQMIQKSGPLGPLFGSLLGVVPQCGFSTAASGFYAGRVISLGTLYAVYLSTSDEMLPVLISEKADITLIAGILLLKVIIAMAAGFAVDFVIRRKHHEVEEEHHHIHEMCNHEHCHCNEKNIFISALSHTIQIFLFIFVITLAINVVVELAGLERISLFLENKAVLGVFISGIIGLVPNCASSVLITQLYLNGLLGFGAMIAGLLVGAGAGLLILFRVNENLKENLKITLGLYAMGVAAGLILSFIFG